MAKNPVFPLYYTDFLNSVLTWDDEPVGAYIRLLIYQWDKGGLPNDTRQIFRIALKSKKHWDGLLKEKFPLSDDGLLKNKKLEEVRENALKFSAKQSSNGAKGGRPSKPKQNPNDNPNESLHNETELEIETETELEINIWKENGKILKQDALWWEQEILLHNPLSAEEIDRALKKYWLKIQRDNNKHNALRNLRAGFKSYLDTWIDNSKNKTDNGNNPKTLRKGEPDTGAIRAVARKILEDAASDTHPNGGD